MPTTRERRLTASKGRFLIIPFPNLKKKKKAQSLVFCTKACICCLVPNEKRP